MDFLRPTIAPLPENILPPVELPVASEFQDHGHGDGVYSAEVAAGVPPLDDDRRAHRAHKPRTAGGPVVGGLPIATMAATLVTSTP